MDPFQQQQQQQQQMGQVDDGQSWWFKWVIKGSAVILGSIALLLGVLTTISFSAGCIIGGLVLSFGGILVLALEVPICCSFIEIIRPLTSFSEGRPHWQKVAVYMVCPIVTVFLCTSVITIVGSLCICGVAALYFVLTVGKKANLGEMRTRANPMSESKSNLANDQQAYIP
jgi:hypothetical protein